ncbi:hypothetical protein SNOG_00722 [Parastagonospora nodorum SN15]|uniref:Uncharacterized protein n=1 Tax=Phaeosphaeria nodorum (strain SN15 / ATCC MYA-4574 / FGSC 10173) TaxID=321614 RepID=Q0V5J2_PHANO|nr:hypothetical protein SNOG_00722 [Parastagonospora nodorum SN15]EAT92217.1 hypothetical protein SNOG_00722 [Parastagonospora nodorum SN15]
MDLAVAASAETIDEVHNLLSGGLPTIIAGTSHPCQ